MFEIIVVRIRFNDQPNWGLETSFLIGICIIEYEIGETSFFFYHLFIYLFIYFAIFKRDYFFVYFLIFMFINH